jgi:hypothetical protein
MLVNYVRLRLAAITLRFRRHDEPGSSVSVVSDYGLDGRDSIPDTGRRFFL